MTTVALPALGALVMATFLLSLCLCQVIMRAARRFRLVDVPNERSLHKVPVPRLGGVAIVVSVGVALAAGSGAISIRSHGDTLAWLAGATVIALLGLADDLRQLPALVRLLVQLVVAALVLAHVLDGKEICVAAGLSLRVAPGLALGVSALFVVGVTNIYNFMDGLDGLAATQNGERGGGAGSQRGKHRPG